MLTLPLLLSSTLFLILSFDLRYDCAAAVVTVAATLSIATHAAFSFYYSKNSVIKFASCQCVIRFGFSRLSKIKRDKIIWAQENLLGNKNINVLHNVISFTYISGCIFNLYTLAMSF